MGAKKWVQINGCKFIFCVNQGVQINLGAIKCVHGKLWFV